VAKARPIRGLDPAMPYAAAAAQIVAMRSAEMEEHSVGVLDLSDIEILHDMRVATRRLRAALEVFEVCFPRDAYRLTLEEVKTLADALGERRDRDVAIEALESFASHLPAADRPGIENLAARLRGEQAVANESLAPHVTKARIAAVSDRVRGLVEAAEESAGTRAPHLKLVSRAGEGAA
jgi:CHAD domain-containing protein